MILGIELQKPCNFLSDKSIIVILIRWPMAAPRKLQNGSWSSHRLNAWLMGWNFSLPNLQQGDGEVDIEFIHMTSYLINHAYVTKTHIIIMDNEAQGNFLVSEYIAVLERWQFDSREAETSVLDLLDLVLCISSSHYSFLMFIINGNHKYSAILSYLSHFSELSKLRRLLETPN